MAHTLRKYLSNRGSALFMVLSTMTALMVCCTAMYFSVVSSRSTQYAIFNQQQSYQSAVSLSDALIAGMISGDTAFSEVSDKIWNLEEGKSLTTNGNGFSAFDPAGVGRPDDDQAGAYMINAVRLPDEKLADGKVVRVFDITITASVNGTKEVYHNIIQMQQAETKDSPPGPSNVFTATGYVPNDVFLDGGNIVTDVFFDNEHTVINAYGGKNMSLSGNLSCGGSLTNNNYIIITADHPVTFAIRGTYKATANQHVVFAEPTGISAAEKNRTRSTVMIGGDCYLSNEANFENANVYVLGDLYLDTTTLQDSSRYFVDGDVILKSGNAKMSLVYVNGAVKNCSSSPAGKWTGHAQGLDKDGLLTVSEMISKLDEKTTTGTYYKWIVDTEDFLPEEQVIKFDTDKNNQHPTRYLSYSDSTKGCVIKDLTLNHPNNGGYGNLTLVIDTGEDPDNVYTIKLQGNRDYIGDSTKETFCWFPKNITPGSYANGATTWAGNGSNTPLTILVMGRGSVVIDIPKGVTYQDDDHLKVMHYGWFALNGGEEIYFGGDKAGKDKEYIVEHTVYKRKGDSGSDADFFAQFIHRNCKEGDGCSYTEEETTRVCSGCNGKMTNAVCDIHGSVDTYCPNCQPNRMDNTGKCSNHLGKKEIDSYLMSHPDVKTKLTGSDGKLVYPSVNIFLVSCDENADIRLSSRASADNEKDPQVFIQNGFFGYVYAPYITFKAGPSNSGGGMVRMLGGMTVSDYIIDDSYSLLSCWPDKLPEDLMSEESFENKLPGIVNKSWKIDLKAH